MLRPTDDIRENPRFLQGIELFHAGEFFEAGDCFEDLFFDAAGSEELELVRLFLQLSVGMVHGERHQWRAGGERLREALLALDRLCGDHGFDLPSLRAGIVSAIEAIGAETVPSIPITRKINSP